MIAVHEILYEQALCSIIYMNLLQALTGIDWSAQSRVHVGKPTSWQGKVFLKVGLVYR